MFHDVVQAVVSALLAIPPVRFVMGLVDSRWRPLWAALWLAVIGYVVARTLNQLAARRLRLQLMRESLADPLGGRARDATASAVADATATSAMSSAPTAAAPTAAAMTAGAIVLDPAPAAAAPSPLRATVPVPVLLAALGIGALAVAVVAFVTRSPRDATPPSGAGFIAAPDSSARTDSVMDVRWRSGRMDDDDCIGTFEVSNGNGTRVAFTAFVIDSSGAVMARDSARVDAAVSGLFVEFRFRHVDCDEIADWRLEARTPKAQD